MLPHPARPAEPGEDVQKPGAKDGNSGLGNRSSVNSSRTNSSDKADKNPRGTTSTGSAAFIPPLAPSPPPGTPPTVHTRLEAERNSLWQVIAGAEERAAADVQPDSFGSILLGAPTNGSSGRAYHLRSSFNPARAVQRLVSGRATEEDARIEAEQLNPGPHEPEPGPHEPDPETQERRTQEPGTQKLPQHPNPNGHFQGDHLDHEPLENFGHAPAGTVRRTAVTVCTAAAIGASYGLTRTAGSWPDINHSAGSVLDPAASMLGVYPWVWLAWIPVLAGAAGYAALQWIPSQRSSSRQAWSGPISAGSAVVAALWLWAVQTGNPAAAFWSAALGTGIGLTAIHVSNTWPGESRTEKAAADLPAKVLLGVCTIALLTGLGSWFTALGTDVAGWGPAAWALVALVATVIGITTVSMTDRGHLAAALTVVVGLTGIGFTRLLSEQASMPVAAGAFVGAFLILVSAGSRRHQVDHARRRRQREWLRAEASVRAAGEAPGAVRI